MPRVEHRPLLPGRYDLVIVHAERPRQQTIWIDQAPDPSPSGAGALADPRAPFHAGRSQDLRTR
jgi:hypothetical protein